MTFKTTSNPFVGLRSFECDESLLFFGRQEQTMELLQRLHQHHFVAVVGGSGSGKSSLIKAGLIPSLKAGYLVNDRDRWMLASMKPGENPLCNMADAMLEQMPNAAISSNSFVEKIKEEGADAVLELLQPVMEGNTNFFLLVDQFEELFRFSLEQKEVEKRDEATDFVNILLELTEHKNLPVYVVITMRSDFVGDCAQFYNLPEAMNRSQYIVPRLNRQQLKSIIEGPVKLYNGQISPALTTRLLNDVQLVKDELPLIQHALMRIWDYEVTVDKSGELDLNDYVQVGGIEKALSNHADEALAGMTEGELLLTKKIFQSLTVVDEKGRKVRRPVRLKELEAITGAGSVQLLSIINRFIEGNRSFLITSKVADKDDLLIDISHESLIRQWSTLSSWVDEEAESGKTFMRLTEAAELYGQKKKDLLAGNELQPILLWYYTFQPGAVWAQRYSPNYENSFQYLKASEEEWKAAERRKKARKRNLMLLMYSMIFFAFLVLGWFLMNENNLKVKALAARKAAESNAEQAMAQRDELKDSLDAVTGKVKEHLRTAYISGKQEVLDSISHDTLTITPSFFNQVDTMFINKTDTAFLNQQSAQASYAYRLMQNAYKEIGNNPTVALRLAEAALEKDQYRNNLMYYLTNKIYKENAFYKTVYNYYECPIFHAVSPDGSRVLTVLNNRGKLLNMDDASSADFKGLSKNVYAVSFSPDGKSILGGTDDGNLMLWDGEGNTVLEVQENPKKAVVSALAFAPDSKAFLTASGKGKIRLWNAAGQLQQELKTAWSEVHCLTFSPDGSKVFINYKEAPPQLWHIAGNKLETLPSITGKIYSVAFSPDGTKVLTGFQNGTERLWDLKGFLLREYREKNNSSIISSVAFSKDGTRILTGSQDGTARLWHINGNLLKEFKGGMTSILLAAFTKDETQVVTGSLDGLVRTWDISGSFDRYSGEYMPKISLVDYLQNDKMLDRLTLRDKRRFGIE